MTTRLTRSGPTRLSPLTPAGYAELLLRQRIDRARQTSDLGASVIEWVIISALLVGIAATVGTILLTKIRDKANSIDLNTNTP